MAKVRDIKGRTFPVKIDLDGLIIKMEMRPYKGGAQEVQAWIEKLEDTESIVENIPLMRERFCASVASWDLDGPLHTEECPVLTEGKEPSYAEDGSCALCSAPEDRIPLTVDGLRRADVSPALISDLLVLGSQEINTKKPKRGRY